MADRLEPKYGEQTLKKFADEIGIAVCTVERYRDVFRAFKGIPAPGRESLGYSVARELATHPDRAGIIERCPDITKSMAAKLMRGYRTQQKDPDEHAMPTETEAPQSPKNFGPPEYDR